MKEAKSMSITPVLECLKTGKLILSSWDNGYSWVVHDWKGARGRLKCANKIYFLTGVLVAQVFLAPNILNCYLDLYMFLHACYTSLKKPCER